MARADYEGVPTVEARIQAPDDYQRVNASPDAFGAALARGGEEAGAGLLKLSDFYGATAASQATTNFVTERQKILTGDPSNMVTGPDGQPTVDGGYLGLTGQAALDARESTLQKLDDLYAQTASTLKTPQSREMFANEARRYLAQAQVDIGGHYTQQSKVWAENTSNEAATVNLGLIGANPSIPNPAAEDSIRQSYVRLAQIMPEKYGSTDGALLKANRDIAAARIRGQLAADPIASVKTYRDNKDVLAGTPLGLELNRQASDAAALQLQGIYSNPNNMTQFGFGEGGAAMQGSVSPGSDALHKAFLGQESGNNSNVGNSSAGAQGPGQIMAATFNRFAKPGESITSPADNRAVSARILDHYAQQYNGDPARIAVAYFSGPGNVAPAGAATPWKRDVADTDGTHVSKYVAGIQGRLGQSGGGDQTSTGASTDTETRYLDFVRGKATEVFPDEPGIVEHVVRGVQSDLQSNFAIGGASARTGVENQLQNADAEVSNAQVVTGKLPSDAEIHAAYMRDPEKAQAAIEARDEIASVSGLLVGMADKTPEQIQQLVESVKPDPGRPDTYARQVAIAHHVDAALMARAKAISDDPGNYVVMTHPDVAALGAKVWGPGGTMADYGAFADAVKSHLNAIGVADEDVRVLPKPIASSMVRGLEQNPEQSYSSITKMEQQLGTHWPQFFRDLVQQGGLSPDYQMVAELDASNGTLLARAYDEPRNNNGKRIEESIQPTTITSIRKAVEGDPALTQLKNSVTNSTGSAVMRGSLNNAVQVLTWARMVYKGEDQPTAQASAIKAFTDKWEFMPSGGARVPKDRYDDVGYNAGATLRWASTTNLAVPKNAAGQPLVGGLGQPSMANYVDALRAAPTWITSPNADALWLKDPQGKIVMQAKNGQPVAVAFKYRKITSYPVPPPSLNPHNEENR